MAPTAAKLPWGASETPVSDIGAVLDALADSVLVVGGRDNEIRYANAAAEQLFDASRILLCKQRLGNIVPADSPLFALITQARNGPSIVSEHGIPLAAPRIGRHLVTVQIAPLPEQPDSVVLTFHQQSMARKIDGQLNHRSAARSVSAMAAMLAHEVKNPLSGIRGAAQLLEQSAVGEDQALTRLICEEADRICTLVDDMEVFSDERPVARIAVNIHEVLEHVRSIAVAGFARGLNISERYDPSLPPVYGSRDQLIQVFLNLVKNASEAIQEDGGEIRLETAYRQGIRLAAPGSSNRVALPLMISVRDNGEGIPNDLRPHLFDPFVSTKAKGKGLGLALVAKIINDHGGVIEFDSEPRRTVFRVMLPAAPEETPRL